jgi:hypothetical protein
VSFVTITLRVASQRVFIFHRCLFRYGISPKTFGYTFVYANVVYAHAHMAVRGSVLQSVWPFYVQRFLTLISKLEISCSVMQLSSV